MEHAASLADFSATWIFDGQNAYLIACKKEAFIWISNLYVYELQYYCRKFLRYGRMHFKFGQTYKT